MPPTVREIQATVAARCGVTLAALLGPRRHQPLARARQMAMLLAHELREDCSLPQLGRAFHRDHTTVLHGIRKARSLAEQVPEFAADLTALRETFNPRPAGGEPARIVSSLCTTRAA